MTRFQQVSWRADGRRRGQHKHPGWEAPARSRRRPLPPRLHSDPARSEDRYHHRFPARCPRLLRSPRHPRARFAYRQRQQLSLPSVPQCLPAHGPPTPPALVLTRLRPTARPNVSSKPLCANWPTLLTGKIPTNETTLSFPGPTTTTWFHTAPPRYVFENKLSCCWESSTAGRRPSRATRRFSA